jgi:hypothetical protein
MPVIRLLPETANKAWRALIETGEPVHRIPPAQDSRYVISHYQLARLQQLQLKFEILAEMDGDSFPNFSKKEKDLPHPKKQTSWYQSFKQEMLKKHPELAEWTKEQFVFEFERLSRKAAEGLPFETLEEMECFMRREKFDPRRY